MMPSLPVVIRCPKCGNQMKKQVLYSGNTFGAACYTDGKMEAPMLPELPQITKCPACKELFWIDEAEEVGEYFPMPLLPGEKEFPSVRFLSITDYDKALRRNLSRNTEDELYLRRQLWWKFNDRVRRGKPLVNSPREETIWKTNLALLEGILDDNDPEQRIMKAEVLRHLGFFLLASTKLEFVRDEQYKQVVDIIKQACKEQKTEVLKVEDN
ncbi:hypothetical protein [Pontibacter flavimaris]|uniref:CpXC domain-containing protein n=1 Tax=Pontibacter flavimaris TaxID=1797110 RepID=A0A1Q5PIN5_9BACT|nr:hypothetical protein [Pontibacter flavimaris]OKL42084.1 hypothetical protein A3841_08790 [Pontibacter flavimaris]